LFIALQHTVVEDIPLFSSVSLIRRHTPGFTKTLPTPRQLKDREYVDAHPCPKWDINPGSKIASSSKIRALDRAVTFVFVAVVLGTYSSILASWFIQFILLRH